MIALRGGRVVLADRVLEPGTLLVSEDRIADVVAGSVAADRTIDCHGRWVLPGFIDIHVHGVEGYDSLDAGWPIEIIARRLPRYGVTAFCPTSVACSAEDVAGLLDAVRQAARQPDAGARVLGAHLESNFINPEYRGAQPRQCVRLVPLPGGDETASDSGADVLRAIDRAHTRPSVVTMASEVPGGLDLVRWLTTRGIHVSLGHSGATYDEAMAGFDAGATQVTHLFNRMSPFHHREPGLVGATLDRDDVMAELICDGFHVHPMAARFALRAKGVRGIMATTDATAGAGLGVGARARLGRQPIVVREAAAFLEDGTLAGGTVTMDGAFRNAIERFGCSVREAVDLCATTPARALKLQDQGVLRPGALADVVVLDERFSVLETWVSGSRRWAAEA